MKIYHKKDNFLYTIFPELIGGSNELIISTLTDYYSYGPFLPKVSIDNDLISVEINVSSILNEENDYRKVVNLCEKQNYDAAKPILFSLLKSNPTNSEYHRILGQIYSDEGNHEEAINSMIDALKWNPKNEWALLMIGNIFARDKNDIDTALKYYDHVLAINPNDHFAINNIGANLMQQGRIQEAKKYFEQVLKIENKYPNTHYGLSVIAEMEGDLHSAFYSAIQSLKLNSKRDGLYQNSFKQAIEVANKLIESDQGKKIFRAYRSKLEFEGETKIDIVAKNDIPTAAKMELAENYNRDKHIVLYNDTFPAIEHLIMHELVHLDFTIQARKSNLHQLFVSNQSHKAKFLKSIESSINKLEKMGIPEDSILTYCNGLFEGMNRQIYNTPIDLFIEDFLFNEFSELRPYQFISLLKMNEDGLNAVTDKRVVEISPKEILTKSKIYNIINALQLNELFGFDIIDKFKATPGELKQAKDLYNEYKEYSSDKEPAEEYELVQNWANDLQLNSNFELVNESTYRSKNSDIDDLLERIEKDPLGLNEDVDFKEQEMAKFQKSQENLGTNMAVVMFMVDAFEYFENKPLEEIKKIAFEIAMQGTQGYNPEKKDYRISSISNKKFSGYHILAYYYISWSIAVPEMLDQLKLPYDDEYKMAKTLYKSKK